MNYQSYEDYMRSVLGNSYANEYTNVPTYANPANVQSVSNFRNVNTPNSMNTSPMNTSNMVNSRQMDMQTQTNMSNQMNMTNQSTMPGQMNMQNQGATSSRINMQNQTSFQSSMRENTEQNMEESEEILRIQRMYPDIYCLLMPMVNKIVEENNDREITDNLIESMTMEIYNNIEDDMINSSRTTNSKTNNTMAQSSQTGNTQRQSTQSNSTTTRNTVSNTMQNSRRIGNPTLRDLIKILIIRRLLEHRKNTRRSSVVDNNFSVPVSQNLGMNNSYVPVMNRNPIMNQGPVMQRTTMQNLQIQSSPMQSMDRQVSANINRMDYPFTNYFATPYPEDEYAN